MQDFLCYEKGKKLERNNENINLNNFNSQILFETDAGAFKNSSNL